uniref:Uncharacterized protein n=1 Tax=Megaselia scalaris TaxID=36166 RepID=T1GXB6_MEGSC
MPVKGPKRIRRNLVEESMQKLGISSKVFVTDYKGYSEIIKSK